MREKWSNPEIWLMIGYLIFFPPIGIAALYGFIRGKRMWIIEDSNII